MTRASIKLFFLRFRWLIAGLFLLSCLGIILFFPKKEDPYNLPDQVDFNFHIRPILSNNCFTCHGPDSSSREADLRLDILAGATKKLEDGTRAVVPGKPSKSELIHRVSSRDPDLQMPPPKQNKILSGREVALLEKWIDQGAKWKTHWAFIPPEAPRIPKVNNPAAAANEIDRFVLQKLEAKGLAPAPIAEKEKLIRRLSYLLIGLPPAPASVKAFVEDSSEQAYEKVVDRLLASPQFGERWARHWMDLVRYAEARGHEFDYNITGAWQYRDYLIRAFNADIPYDQFVKEHLAGDMLEYPRIHPEDGYNESMVGTAFVTLGEGKHSPVSIKQEEADRIDNIIDVTTKTFQALTVGCARCHDHKFDDIPTTDYYSLYGIFESSRYTQIAGRINQDAFKNLKKLQNVKSSIRRQLAKTWKDEKKWVSLNPQKRKVPPYIMKTRQIEQETPASADTFDIIGDFRQGHWEGWISNGIAFGKAPVSGDLLTDENKTQLIGIDQTKASSRQYGIGIQGALRSPNFIIDKDYITVKAAGKKAIVRVIINNFELIQWPIYGNLQKSVNAPEMKDYLIDVSPWKGEKAYVELLPGEYNRHTYQIFPSSYIEAQYVIAHNGDIPDMNVGLSGEINDIEPIAFERALNAWEQGKAKRLDLLLLDRGLKKGMLDSSLENVADEWAKIDSLAKTLYDSTSYTGLTEGYSVESPVFIRGKFSNISEETVPHRFFTALSEEGESFDKTQSGRLELAEAIGDPGNPLTARVMVNRIWHYVFGKGIVETVDNFGLQGKLPTHPELLDHLALKFVEEGWSMKRMIKRMVMSNTFKRSSTPSDESMKEDPQNLLLQHFPIIRIEGEAIRDGMLAVSGCLDSTLYGPSIPIHLTPFMSGRGRPARSGPLDGYGRRSVYISVRRNFLSPMMLVFDTPIPFTTFGKRNVSNVPAQSLTLMNDPFVLDQANMWAQRVLQKELTKEERIEHIYQLAFSRAPTKAEMNDGLIFLSEQCAAYEVEDCDTMDALEPWRDYCHTMFNLKEFIHLL